MFCHRWFAAAAFPRGRTSGIIIVVEIDPQALRSTRGHLLVKQTADWRHINGENRSMNRNILTRTHMDKDIQAKHNIPGFTVVQETTACVLERPLYSASISYVGLS